MVILDTTVSLGIGRAREGVERELTCLTGYLPEYAPGRELSAFANELLVFCKAES